MIEEALLARGLDVRGTVAEPDRPSGTHCHLLPAPTDLGFLPQLMRIAAEQRVDLLIPTALDELAPLAAARAVFRPETRVLVAGAGAVALCRDRLLTSLQLARRQVPSPRVASPRDYRGPRAALAAFGARCVVRPRQGPGARMLAEMDAQSLTRLGDQFVLQELVPGPGFRVLIHRPLDKSHGHRAVEVLQSDGHVGGHGGASDLVGPVERGHHEDVERVAQAAVRALGLTGPACVNVRRNSMGEPLVLSIRACVCRHLHVADEFLDALLHDGMREGTRPAPTAPKSARYA